MNDLFESIQLNLWEISSATYINTSQLIKENYCVIFIFCNKNTQSFYGYAQVKSCFKSPETVDVIEYYAVLEWLGFGDVYFKKLGIKDEKIIDGFHLRTDEGKGILCEIDKNLDVFLFYNRLNHNVFKNHLQIHHFILNIVKIELDQIHLIHLIQIKMIQLYYKDH